MDSGASSSRVAVSGTGGVIGARVLQWLAQSFDVIDIDQMIDADQAAHVSEAVSGADALVHLRLTREITSDRLRWVLAAADVPHLTLVSSASVYGAWPNHPTPISEDMPVRPNLESSFAVHHADAERTVLEWRDAAGERSGQSGRQVAILRPAPVVSSGLGGPIGEAMLAAAPIRTGSDDPPVQFLHLDDLASAVVLAVRQRLAGVFNVAPDGWLAPSELRALLGARPKVRLPLPAPERLDRYVARRVGHAAPDGLLPFTRFSWVVANDRLRAAGWEPRYSSAQAYVIADAGMPWDDLNARQRQYAMLAGAGAALVVGGWAATAWLRRSYALR
ncbi:NAD-dependent epimerase/dehydratase family protein [Candidatus Poriferisodalis sp.]|uniref:NAD-dependent epimerase/dehydratase family protein n=1 Tax=Candidatus Poriferisodalis sp. TaxID=3101277 RepID=UPI003B012DE9